MNDPIAKPAKDTVEWFGVTVPIYEHMLVGEIDELQEILSNASSGFRKDLECFAVIARYRSDAKLKVDKLLREPVDQVAFVRDLRRLLDPFVRAQKALVMDNRAAAAMMMTPEQLDSEIAMMTRLLEELRRMRGEQES